jgi:DNA-binding response OmpR family regulator
MAKTVLLLEDDKAFREPLVRLLRQRGLRVLEAGRVSEAKALLAEKPDLFVVDGLLPDGSGRDFLKELTPEQKKAPAVFVSAFWKNLRDHQTNLRELGVAAIVHKPVDPATLVGQIERLLGVQEQGAIPPELALQLAALKEEYGRDLSGRFQELRRLISAARRAPADGAARKEVRALAHKLAGTAGSYGFALESTAAAAIESQAIASETGSAVEVEACWTVAEGTVVDVLLDRALDEG